MYRRAGQTKRGSYCFSALPLLLANGQRKREIPNFFSCTVRIQPPLSSTRLACACPRPRCSLFLGPDCMVECARQHNRPVRIFKPFCTLLYILYPKTCMYICTYLGKLARTVPAKAMYIYVLVCWIYLVRPYLVFFVMESECFTP